MYTISDVIQYVNALHRLQSDRTKKKEKNHFLQKYQIFYFGIFSAPKYIDIHIFRCVAFLFVQKEALALLRTTEHIECETRQEENRSM